MECEREREREHISADDSLHGTTLSFLRCFALLCAALRCFVRPCTPNTVTNFSRKAAMCRCEVRGDCRGVDGFGDMSGTGTSAVAHQGRKHG